MNKLVTIRSIQNSLCVTGREWWLTMPHPPSKSTPSLSRLGEGACSKAEVTQSTGIKVPGPEQVLSNYLSGSGELSAGRVADVFSGLDSPESDCNRRVWTPPFKVKVSLGLGSAGFVLFLTILPRMPGRMMMKVTSEVRKMATMTANVVSIGKVGLGPA